VLIDIIVDFGEAESGTADFLEDGPVCGHMLDDYGGVSGGVIWRKSGGLGTGDGKPLTANCFSICDGVSNSYKGGGIAAEQEERTSSRLSASSALKLAGAATDMVGDLERGQMICSNVYGC